MAGCHHQSLIPMLEVGTWVRGVRGQGAFTSNKYGGRFVGGHLGRIYDIFDWAKMHNSAGYPQDTDYDILFLIDGELLEFLSMPHTAIVETSPTEEELIEWTTARLGT